jgi:hypothetical protein
MLAFPTGQGCVKSVFKILDSYTLILIKKVINFEQRMNLKKLRGLWTNQGKLRKLDSKMMKMLNIGSTQSRWKRWIPGELMQLGKMEPKKIESKKV